MVEVVAAHNLMPKDGQGSSSAFVEVEFEHQRQRTSVKHKDLNPIWNERLVFSVSDAADLPYRVVDVAVYNEPSSASSRNFLGKARFTAAGVPAPGEESVPQLFTLDKRSYFSHIRGDITLKVYRILAGDEISGTQTVSKVKDPASKQQQHQQQKQQHTPASQIQQQQAKQPQQNQQMQKGKQNHNQNHSQGLKQGQNQAGTGSGPADFKPVVLGGTQPPRPHDGYPGSSAYWPAANHHHQEFSLKETTPFLSERPSATYDLVEQMKYLYVRVVRARGLSHNGSAAPHVEVKLGNYRGLTKVSPSLVWEQVFAYSSDCIQSSSVEILLKEKEGRDEFLGFVGFDLAEVPRRAPPDSPLAPQWYRLENRKGDKSSAGEIMLAIWFGTQADECFSEAWHSSSASVQGDGLSAIKSKVYISPKLWYLRVAVIEAQDLVPGDKNPAMAGRFPELFVKAQVGNQVMFTRPARLTPGRSISSPLWNEDLIFVVAEPFEDYLTVFVEDRGEVIGRVLVPVSAVEQRSTDKPVSSRWFSLEGVNHGRFSSRLHLRLSLDGGYHVLDEASMYASDLRPTAKQLWEPCIGVLEMGILGAAGLVPVKTKDGKAVADAYCVAKYGPKWVRTRTVVDSLSPRWNEQYQWEVFDPSTVITVAVFDNSHLSGSATRDSRVGKVRIRLSTLESDRLYTHAYPLLMLHPSGVKKMGELHLAVRFSCSNPAAMLHLYLRPPLPQMHYLEPISVLNSETLRYRACEVVAARLSRAEPPLGREVIEYMLDRGSNLWSMRKSKANFFRLISVLALPIAICRWIDTARTWQHPAHSLLLAVSFLSAVACPESILPLLFVSLALQGLWRFRRRPRQPPYMDLRLSQAESVHPDELDEELDSFPTSLRNLEVMSMRYDRLRSVAMRMQSMMGDVATQCERCQALIGWRDPRATLLFLMICLGAAALFYLMPLRLVIGLWGVHALLPPKLRSRLPSPFVNFFKRLPSKADTLL